MHAVSTYQITDILHFNETSNITYEPICVTHTNLQNKL